MSLLHKHTQIPARTSKLSFMDATGSRAGGSSGDQNGKENDEDKKQGAAPAKKVSLSKLILTVYIQQTKEVS